ncbi:ABC transporter permease [Humidesulfovibrio idahonensis]
MNILTIALRNARKKWVRTSLLLLVFSLGVVSIVALSFVSRVVGEGLEKKLVSFGANILVAPKSEKLTVSYGGFALGDMLFDVNYLDEADTVAKIDTIELRKNVSVIAPKLVVMDHVQGTAVAIVGVRFEQEKQLKGYWLVEQGAIPGETPEQAAARAAMAPAPEHEAGMPAATPQAPVKTAAKDAAQAPAGADGLLAGSAAASKLGLSVGSAVPLGHHTFVVAGILAPTGSEDDNVLLADMDALQRASGHSGKVNFVEVAALCSACPIDDIVAQLATVLPGTEIKTLRGIVEQRMVSVHFVKKLILSVSLVILLTGCSMVGISMLSAVNERKKEIGILRSLGFSRRSVFAIFCAEAAVVGLLAGVAGYVAGYFVSFRILAVLEVEGGGPLPFEPLHLVATALVLALLTSLASLFPAWKAASVEPSEALVTL